MGKALNLTKSGEYAITALSRLAFESERGACSLVSVEALAEEQGLPCSFLAKILSSLVKAGLVRSRSGTQGGIALGRSASEITLLEIIEACQGSYRREACVFYPARRCEGTDCPVYCPLREIEERLRAGLEHITLDRMAAALRRHPDLPVARVMEASDGGGSGGR